MGGTVMETPCIAQNALALGESGTERKDRCTENGILCVLLMKYTTDRKGVLTTLKKSIQIKDSYKIWRPFVMRWLIQDACYAKYDNIFVEDVLHRSYADMYCEWWWHNIGYYLTRNIALFESINERCKDVDLEESQRW